ncbi:MAG: hypothetical protein V4690_01920 [Patescibacteria group bacterium]
MIESYIKELRDSFGPARLPVKTDKLASMHAEENYLGMVRHVQQLLRLDLKVKLLLVNSGGPVAPAWLRAPGDLPIYGTPRFREVTVEVYLRKSFLKETTYEQATLAIAHELCHVVLYSVKHRLQEVEEAVDLTSMLLGFREIWLAGCSLTVTKSPPWYRRLFTEDQVIIKGYGYLTRDEVAFASEYMAQLK